MAERTKVQGCYEPKMKVGQYNGMRDLHASIWQPMQAKVSPSYGCFCHAELTRIQKGLGGQSCLCMKRTTCGISPEATCNVQRPLVCQNWHTVSSRQELAGDTVCVGSNLTHADCCRCKSKRYHCTGQNQKRNGCMYECHNLHATSH